jgi:predicted permease
VRGYSADAGQVTYAAILDRLNELPGVVQAGAARVTVLSGAARSMNVSTDGLAVTPDNRNALSVRANVISDGYLTTMGIPVRQGRNFTAADRPGAPRVTIVSQALASRLHPAVDPVGRTVMLGDDPLQIVGVVPDTIYRSTTEQSPPPFLYLPVAQNYESGLTLHIRTAGQPLGEIAAVRRVLREVDPQLVLGRPRTLRDEFNVSVGDQRLMATLIGLFGLVALVLAAIGLYGVMTHLANQRTTEIGVRIALGAEPASILRLLLNDGLRLVAMGCVLGLAGAFAAARFVRAQLFGIDAIDPLTFTLVCAMLAVVGAVACLLPALRAMRIDPITALRAPG